MANLFLRGISEKEPREAKMEDQKLQDHFKFDEDDLQANRNGNFLEKPKKELSSNVSGSIQH